MITVTLNEDSYAYDIHSLVKAFYPEQEVKVFVEGEKDLAGDPGLPAFFVHFYPDRICAGLCREEPGQGSGKQEAQRVSREEGQWLCKLTAPGDRVQTKNDLKQLLYGILGQCTNKRLPWGTLTGIRPVKIAMQLLEQGKTEEEILEHMRRVYLTSGQKAALSAEIAKKERKILSGIHCGNGYSLYIGIPFCPTTCLYCSFTSFPICVWKDRVGEYLDALDKEMDFVKEIYGGKTLDSVYIGGGTPTTLDARQLERLLDKVRRTFDLDGALEFTVEAGRADSITADKLEVMKRYGVGRISVNPQTMNQRTLEVIGRQHTVEQVEQAFYMARGAGFDNINMDLILGLPGENESDVAYTMERIRRLAPDNLTVHSLAVKRASRLSQWILENGLSQMHNTDRTMEIAEQSARALGMAPYYLYRQKNMSGNFENVGYAKEGKEGIYNILIMEEKQTIVACGAGSISKKVYSDGRIERCENVKDVSQYIERIGEMIERKRVLLKD